MNEVETMQPIPVVTTDQVITTKPTPSNLSLKDGDFASDIAKLKSEMKLEEPTEVNQISQPTTPAQPEQAAVTETEQAKVEVPEKFVNKETGNVDMDKVAKSTLSAEEALAKYLTVEKELKRKMNEVKAVQNAYITPPVTPTPTQTIPVNTDFAKKLEEDIAKEGAGVVLSKLFTAAQESVEERVRVEIDAIKAHNSEQTTKQQVEAIGKADPWVYSEDGINTLNRILTEQPFLQGAPDMYKAAYLFHKGQQNVSVRSNSQVLTGIPTARPTAPTPSGQAANMTNATKDFTKMAPDVLNAHLKTLTPEQEREFFKRQGFPGY